MADKMKAAAPAEVVAPANATKSTKKPKLAKKNNAHLPRREKKAQMKALAAQALVQKRNS